MATLGDAPPLPSNAPAPPIKALACPNCGGTIEIRAAGYTVEVVCKYCSSRIDVSDPDARLIAAYNDAAAELGIPLGARGKLGGVEWEAIGYLMRSEGGSYPWEEYLLFNPYRGYRWLITDGRGWSLGETLTRSPQVGSRGLLLDGKAYEPFFANGRAQVEYVLGEFYWRVERGEEVETADYVRPGWMLSWEKNPSEESWTLSQLLDPEEVRQAFDSGPLPKKWPPLPHQPSPHGRTLRSFAKAAALTLAALLVMMFVFGGSRTLLDRNITVTGDGREQSATLGPVELDRAYQAVTVRAEAPTLDNAWIDLDYGLVDRATGVAYEASDVAERYSGRDSDGAWSEGSRRATTKFAAIPKGVYDLVLSVSGNRWTGAAPANVTGIFGTDPVADPSAANHEVRIIVSRGGMFFSNFVLAALLILVPLLIVAIRHGSFETARKAESDFAPVADDDEEDEEDE